MKKMLKLMLTASVSTVVMLASCTEGDLPASPTPPATEDTPVQVELKLKSEQMDTRAIDEDAINDINIYFFGNNINYHFYYPEYAPSFVFEILPGTYTLCVVTNVHKDMGGMTKSELIRYKYSVDDMVDDIPMTASMNVRILGPEREAEPSDACLRHGEERRRAGWRSVPCLQQRRYDFPANPRKFSD